ncbi:MAG TPA: Crp/Fnr family transcriptional regulator [Quisquiliibacterium sp.]|nr:Crp/Fnr family transcriptional regulator [Quisquiliibacterium sp.]
MRAPTIKTRTFLANLPMFQGLSSAELDRIAEGTTEVRVTKGQTIFQRGDPCVGFHALIYGQVKLAFVSPQGTEKVIDILGPGQSFGEALMFSDRSYVVYGQALADSLLLHIAKDVIDTEIASDPHLARVMLASLSRRLVGLIQDVEAYSLRSGMQRVIGYLLRDVDEHAEQPEGEPVRITLDANKGVIASRLNLTPEHFSRILGELSHEGAIAVRGAEITILDPGRLRSQLC